VVSDIKYHDIYRYLVKTVDTDYVSIPIGLNDTYGDEVVIARAIDFGGIMIILEMVYDKLEGTFASGETITIKHIIVYHDGTRYEMKRSYTTTQIKGYGYGTSEFFGSRATGKRVVEIRAQAKTNQLSTSVVASCRVFGWVW